MPKKTSRNRHEHYRQQERRHNFKWMIRYLFVGITVIPLLSLFVMFFYWVNLRRDLGGRSFWFFSPSRFCGNMDSAFKLWNSEWMVIRKDAPRLQLN